jgi:adenylate cyclase
MLEEPLTSPPDDARASSAGAMRRPAGWPLARLLAVVLAGLVALTAALVLALTWGASLRNTFDLLNDRSIGLAYNLRAAIETHLQPAEDLAGEAARQIAAGGLDPSDRVAFGHWLMGALAAVPQVRGIGVVPPDLAVWSVHRAGGAIVMEPRARVRPGVIRLIAEDAKGRPPQPYWGDVEFVDGASVISLRVPIVWPGGGKGLLVVGISLQEISRHLARQQTALGWTGFILRDQTHVLAHPYLDRNPGVLTEAQPMLPLGALADTPLARVWNATESRVFGKSAAAGVRVLFDDPIAPRYIFVLSRIDPFGERPWYYGAYNAIEAVDAEVERAVRSGLLSLALVAVAVVIAILIGHRIARPLRRSAEAAARIGRLELDGLEPLPRSRVRELDGQAIAFNRMADGLRTFSTYVPKPLVGLLAKRGFRSDVPPLAGTATILFTDIVGFTRQTERLGAAEVAAFLNHHFSLLVAAVLEEGGIVDKYIGDSVMAFWAPPLSDADGPRRAVAAARRIAAVIADDNRRRAAAGEEPVRVRVGIHTGPALVGNIGAVGRIDYTIVGDTVNVAQRLQDYGRHVDAAAECVILASDATVMAIPQEERGERVGALPIRGREAAVVAWRLQP